jgi:hypothetical protein
MHASHTEPSLASEKHTCEDASPLDARSFSPLNSSIALIADSSNEQTLSANGGERQGACVPHEVSGFGLVQNLAVSGRRRRPAVSKDLIERHRQGTGHVRKRTFSSFNLPDLSFRGVIDRRAQPWH